MRDLFCRFPGCDVPADRCDIDHVRPWPLGPDACVKPQLQMPKTSPDENLLDRHRRLGATFSYPTAQSIWTSPSGKTYTTHPGSRLFFPNWNTTTAELPPTDRTPPPATQAIAA